MLVAALFLSACTEADQVSKKILFSPVTATVTNLGAPVAGATVTRSYEWRSAGQKAADTAVTDASGKFSLPLMTGSSFSTTWLPHEAVINQLITVEQGGVKHEVWVCSKRDYLPNSELEGRPISGTFKLDMAETKINTLCVGKFIAG